MNIAAPPTACTRCDSLMREDTEFSANMARYSLPQRRYVCAMGHSVYTDVDTIPALTVSMGAPVKLPNASPQHERTCARCGDVFHGTKRQKFCSSVCTRAADYERNRKYISATRTGKRLSAEELRVARAMPRPWNSWKRNGTVPVPYAARPAGLSRKWA